MSRDTADFMATLFNAVGAEVCLTIAWFTAVFIVYAIASTIRRLFS